MPHILTITLNPSVDRATEVPRLLPGHKLRCTPPRLYPGGGGINVARVLHRLGAPVQALFPAGGANGALLQQLLAQEGVPARAVPVHGDTRDNLSVIDHSSGEEYRLVMPGLTLGAADLQACLDAAVATAPAPGWLVLSGRLPPGVPDDFGARLIAAVRARHPGCRVVLDGSGPALAAALAAGVDLLKPSLRELSELVNQPLTRPEAQVRAARALVHARQARAVALSLGADGVLLVTAHQQLRLPAQAVPVRSTTGAGDCLVAGLVWARSQGQPWPEALRWGVAAATAAVMQPASALCPADTVHALHAQLQQPT